jgi:hypothetical protein
VSYHKAFIGISLKFSPLTFRLSEALDKINKRLDEQTAAIGSIQKQLAKALHNESRPRQTLCNLNVVSIVILTLGVVFHAIFMWMLARKQSN